MTAWPIQEHMSQLSQRLLLGRYRHKWKSGSGTRLDASTDQLAAVIMIAVFLLNEFLLYCIIVTKKTMLTFVEKKEEETWRYLDPKRRSGV